MSFLSPNSAFMKGLSDLTDAVWINILLVVTGLPLVTVGAALVAAHDAARKSLEGEGHVTSNYFSSFARNWAQATLIWLVFGSTLIMPAGLWMFLRLTPLLVVKNGLSILWVIGFEWVWALVARFENSTGKTMLNAWIFGFGYLKQTILMVVVDLLYWVLIVFSWLYMPQGLFLLFVLGYGTLVMLHTAFIEKVMFRYTTSSER